MEDKDYGRDEPILPGVLAFVEKISNFFIAARNWWEQNAETICTYIEVFSEFGIWMSAVNKLSKEHLMFTDNLTMDYAHEISESDNVKKTLEDYYVNDDYKFFNSLVERCQNSKCLQNHQKFFGQIISAYEREHFQLACTGLFALTDRVLADNTNDVTVVSFNKRINAIKNKMSEKVELNALDKKAFCIYSLMNAEKGCIFVGSSFKNDEPNIINRDWLLHYRTNRKESFFDFLLVLLWLDAIIYMAELSEKEN